MKPDEGFIVRRHVRLTAACAALARIPNAVLARAGQKEDAYSLKSRRTGGFKLIT